jgi:DNA-binding NarL/FixJ family response regulator
VSEILIVEDDPYFRRSIGEAIQELGIPANVHEFSSGNEALTFFSDPAAKVDVALVDLGLPDIDGIAVIQAIHQRFPDSSIMVISVVSSEGRVIDSVRAGAIGYILKGDSSISVKRAIEQILDGNYPISPKIARYLFKLAGKTVMTGSSALPRLTNQETVLLALIAAGKSYKEAAEQMGVTLSTIQSYIRNLYRKLDAHSQTQAISRARENGLL